MRAIYSDGSSKDVTKQASILPVKAGIVTVKTGVLTGTTYGTTPVTVSYGGKTNTVTIMVSNLKQEFTIQKLTANVADIKLFKGSRQPLTVTAQYLDGHTEDVTARATYTVADPETVHVKNGMITAEGLGTTSISVQLKELGYNQQSTRIAVVVSKRDAFLRNEAENFDEEFGTRVEDSTEFEKNVCDMENNDWIKFNAVDFGSGAASLDVRIASATQGGRIEVHRDTLDGPLIATCPVDGTGGWQRWMTRSCDVKDAVGIHDVYFKFIGGSGFLFNINWWQFKKMP